MKLKYTNQFFVQDFW